MKTGSELPSAQVLADILSDHVVKIKPHSNFTNHSSSITLNANATKICPYSKIMPA